MRVLVKHRSMSTSLGIVRNGDIVDLPETEIAKIRVTKPAALEVLPELPLEKPKRKPASKKAPAKKAAAKAEVKDVEPNDND